MDDKAVSDPAETVMNDDDQNDLLYGAKAIGAHLGMRWQQVYHRARSGEIPTFRIGDTICSRKSTLKAWLDEKESILESLLCIRRAGASAVLSYFAPEAARWLA